METKNSIYDQENFKLTENSYSDCDDRLKEVILVVEDMQNIASHSLHLNKEIEVALEKMKQDIEMLNHKFDSLNPDEQQLMFGGQFSTNIVVDDERIIDVDSTKVHVPLYLRLDVISLMLDGHFTGYYDDVVKRNIEQIKGQISKLREKVAGLKYNKMFDSNKHIGALKYFIANSDDVTFTTEDIDGSTYLSIDAKGDTLSPYSNETYGGDGIYPVFGKVSYEHRKEEHDFIVRRQGVVFDEDIKDIKRNAETKKLQELNDKCRDILNGVEMPSVNDLTVCLFNFDINQDLVRALHSVASSKDRVLMSFKLDSDADDKIKELVENVDALASQEIKKSDVDKILNFINQRKKEDALKEAKNRYKSHNLLWRFTHRKLNPAKVDLENTSVEALEELNEMLNDDVKGDDYDQHTK